MRRSIPLLATMALTALGCASEPTWRPTRAPLPDTSHETGPFTIDVLDVGTGLAVLVTGPDFVALFDGGSLDDKKQGKRNRVLAYLEAIVGASGPESCRPEAVSADQPVPERVIDLLVLSHPHADHHALLPDVFACYAVHRVWDAGLDAPGPAYGHFVSAVRNEPGVRVARGQGAGAGRSWPGVAPLQEGAVHQLGRGARATVLRVAPSAHEANDTSIVVRLDLGTRSVLLPGDATGGRRAPPGNAPDAGSAEAALLAGARELLDVDVLVVGHHGSETSSREAFLEAVSPLIAIVSSGPRAFSGTVLPDASVIAALGRTGARVARTDEGDEGCRTATDKVGVDDDGTPGGCSAVRVQIDRSGSLAVVAPYLP